MIRETKPSTEKDLPSSGTLANDVAQWEQIIHNLPPTRAHKVRAAREAIDRHQLDNDTIINEVVARLAEDID